LEKQTISSKKKKPETLEESLQNFGNKVKVWDGEDLEVIGKTFKLVLKSSTSSFNETNDSGFLLCSLILQTILSYILARGMMSEAFKVKYKFPKENINQLGNKIIELSQAVNKPEFVPRLMVILTFAYKNNLLPSITLS